MLKKIYIGFLSLLLLFIAVGAAILFFRSRTNSEQTINKGKFIVKNGNIYKNGSSLKYSGTIVDTVESKIIKYSVVDGKKNGNFFIMYLNGMVQIEGNMLNNKNEGLWKYFYPSGKLESEGYFKKDIVSKKWTWYYENGNVKETGVFINGKRNGKWTLFFRNGDIKAIFLFKNGNVVNVVRANELKNT